MIDDLLTLVEVSYAEEWNNRVCVVNESTATDEDAEWSQFASNQLLAQYDDADAIYDNL